MTEAEAREAARRGLIKAHGGPVADPLAELAELAGEVRALRAQLAGRMAEAPQEMAVLLPAWAGAAALMSKILVDLLGRMPVLDAPGRVAPVDIPAGFVADVIRRLGASLDEPPSPALPPDESEAAPEPPMLDDDQDEPLSASPLGPVRPSPVTDCHHQQVSRFPATGDIVVCAHCSGEWPLAEARRLGIWLAA